MKIKVKLDEGAFAPESASSSLSLRLWTVSKRQSEETAASDQQAGK
jgi:hypothetical protein